jgi:hypothetical protein
LIGLLPYLINNAKYLKPQLDPLMRLGSALLVLWLGATAYPPPVSMTSHCDPTCKIAYESPDQPKLIGDQFGNILKRYDYQYQTTNN